MENIGKKLVEKYCKHQGYGNYSVDEKKLSKAINDALKKELESYIKSFEKNIPQIEMVEVLKLTSTPFAIGKYQVTQKQWEDVMGNNPSYFKGDNLPVDSVSFDDCQAFITKLNELTGKNFRLPTEHEWLVCATINGTLYSGSNNIDEVAWCYKNSDNTTHEVGLLKNNSLGIYDMTGNVWEWCEDWYRSIDKECYVLRGGSWDDGPAYCRAAFRYFSTPASRDYSVGFRLAMTLN